VNATFHDMAGLDRYGEDALAGDLAEGKVQQYMASIDRPLQPFGPRRVPTERAQHTTWTKEVRHAPDFLGWGRFIEVQGSDGYTVIFKKDKLEALTWWNSLMPVFFAVYLTAQDSILICDIASVIWAIAHPESEEMILDADTRNAKTAWRVPVTVLTERSTTDAFAAVKAAKGRKS
jgi:hypothetical protein